jgi:small subunit ribosomal protein S18
MSEEKTTKRNDENQGSDNDRRKSHDRRSSSGSRNFKRGSKRTYYRKKECKLCKMEDKDIDYKNMDLMRKYTTDKGKIVPRRMSGNCAKCQRKIKREIKKARNAALIPFTSK